MPGILASQDSKESANGATGGLKPSAELEAEGAAGEVQRPRAKDKLVLAKAEVSEEEEGPRSPSPDSDDNLMSVSSASEPEQDPKPTDGEEVPPPAMDSESKEDTKKGTKGPDCVNIRLVMPGVATPVDVTLSSRDTVHDLLQYSLERAECCYRSCLSIQHKGKRLDEFFEIGSLEDFCDGDVVELVEEPYTQKDARAHVQRLKDVLMSDLLSQALTVPSAPGGEGISLSFLATVALTNPETSRIGDDLIDPAKLEPPPYILPSHAHPFTPPPITEDAPTFTPLTSDTDKDHKPGSENKPGLIHFYPPNFDRHFKSPDCIKSLAYSQWNPPSSRRKMKGDLLYLELTTLEGVDYYITACSSGFYLNKSQSRDVFDPTPKKTHHLNKHLVGLISQVSPLFKKNFAQLRKFCDARHPFEIIPAPYPVIPWVAPRLEHKPVMFRIEDSMGLKPAPDELVLGQLRDWNEELQTARELPADTVANKIFRERSLFKIHSDFVQASVRGAMAAVDGNLPTLNPGDEFKFRMYMWNNIFFSFAFDGRDHYKEFGGDAGAHAAAAADLQGVAAHERFERKGLCTLGTVLVDYRGYRVVCQSVIPGLLHREHEAAVVYGSIDTGKNIKTDEKFSALLAKAADDFQIRTHKLYADESGETVVELPSSYEVKGIVGNDSRYYALDLFRIYPPDANYMEVKEGSKVRHRMAILRPELMEGFHSIKFLNFLRLVRTKTSGLEAVQRLNKAKAAVAAKKESNDSRELQEIIGQSEEAKKEAKKSNEIKKDTDDFEVAKKDTDDSEAAKKDTEDSKAAKKELDESKESATDTEAAKKDTDPSETEESSLEATPISSPSKSTDQSPSSSSSCPFTGKTELASGKVPKVGHLPGAGMRGVKTMLTQQMAKDAVSGDVPPEKGNPPPSELPPEVEALYLLVGEGLEGEKEVGPEFSEGQSGEETLAGETQALIGEADTLGESLEDIPEVAAAVKEALKEAGSTNLDNFELKYNVDILSPVVKHADPEEVLERDCELVREAGRFLLRSVIPQFVRDCIQLSATPLDGEALKETMHSKGINMRYLGEVARLAAKREDLSHLERLCISEMIIRVAKGRFRKVLQESSLDVTSEAVAHFLNCFLGNIQSAVELSEESALVNGHTKKKIKKKKLPSSQKGAAHSKVSTQSLWGEIVEEVEWYYRYKLDYSSLSDVCSKFGIQRITILREFCRKTGTQLVLREYDFTAQPVFSEDDIASMVPIVKHTDYRSLEAVALFQLAQSKMSAGNLLLAQELLAEAIQMSMQIYGPMHVDIANCYRQAAKVSQLLGDPVSALSSQHKATLIYERVLGVDHPETVTAYTNLALYCHHTKQTAAALRLLYRARYLMLLAFGEDHPEIATCDSNIAIVLLSIGEYKNALVFFESTLRLYIKYYGAESNQTALTHHLIARTQAFLGDFRAALHSEKSTYHIYCKKFGLEDKRTMESSLCLKELTGKAVTMQKTINQMTSRSGAGSKVTYDLPGSWGEVVGMLSGQEPRQSKKSHVVRKRKRPKQPPAVE